MIDTMTRELLGEVAARDFVTINLNKHEERLERILGREVFHRFSGGRQTGWAKRMQVLGFSSVVDTDWALRFKYHGDILGTCVYEKLGSRRTCLQYNGDIPEFALDNLEKYLKNNDRGWHRVTPHSSQILGFISVHSMQPLPVKLVRILPIVDPVMIGWAEEPPFVLRRSGWEVLKYSLGVVIAVWDEYKEVVDYKVDPKSLTLQ